MRGWWFVPIQIKMYPIADRKVMRLPGEGLFHASTDEWKKRVETPHLQRKSVMITLVDTPPRRCSIGMLVKSERDEHDRALPPWYFITAVAAIDIVAAVSSSRTTLSNLLCSSEFSRS